MPDTATHRITLLPQQLPLPRQPKEEGDRWQFCSLNRKRRYQQLLWKVQILKNQH